MSKKEIQKEYKKKIKLFEQYNKYYYEKSSSIVSERELYEIKQSVLLHEKKYNYLS